MIEIPKRVDVLDKGFIELIDLLPHPKTGVSGDLAIVNAARVSFLGESKGQEADKKLLFYLLRNRHTSPFEMVEFKFRCRAPLVTYWQWVRHRMWSANAQCLAGDTLIIFDKPETRRKSGFSVGNKIRIEDLYKRWQDGDQKRISNMHLRTLNEDTMLLESANVANVLYSGKKHAFRIRTSNGREIVCSTKHRFLFEDGWKTLEDGLGLKLINERAVWERLPQLYVNGKPLATANLYTDKDWLFYQYHTRQLSIKEIANLANCSTHTIRKYLTKHDLTSSERTAQNKFKIGTSPWNKGKKYSFDESIETNLARRERARRSVKRGEECNFWKGGISSERSQIGRWTRQVSALIFQRDNYTCAYCGQQARTYDTFHAHHIVPIWANESLGYSMNNLITLHQSCHYHIHSNNLELDFARKLKNDNIIFDMSVKQEKKQQAIKPHSHATPMLVKIIEVEYMGEIDMYDLVVDGPYPNFIANWFVVHNSGRYTPFEEDDFYVPSVWRKQAKSNKQASEGELEAEPNAVLTEKLIKHYEEGFKLYQEALATGVSKEMARLFLPGFSVYYTWVLKVDAHNLMRFLHLRMAPDAQYEIRVYAQAIYEHFFKPALPWTAEAFEQYTLKPNE